jgi:predicted transcriptional regulator
MMGNALYLSNGVIFTVLEAINKGTKNTTRVTMCGNLEFPTLTNTKQDLEGRN